MTTFLMMNDQHQFGRNSSICMMNSRKSIKDLIKKFDKADNKKRDKLYERIDLISNLNSLKTSSNNNDLKENMRPLTLNFETFSTQNYSHQHHEPVQSTIIEKKDSNNLNFETINLDDESFKSYSNKFQRANDLKDTTNNTEKTPTDSNNEILSWNHSRRRSSVQLVKPSSLFKSKISETDEIKENEAPVHPNTVILPRRVSGPIYESRRSSFSAIKPSEIWDSEELPNVIRRNSKIFDEKLNIQRKKSIVINEVEEDKEEFKSSWVTKPKNSVYLVKPSNVKTDSACQVSLNFTENMPKAPETVQSKLLRWCQEHTKKYDNVEIKNFSSSWANGLAFCALVHSFIPNAFDYDELDTNDRRKNFEIAFEAAEKHADIAQLLEVDDMIMMGDRPDSKCIYTYVSTMYTKLNNLKQKKL